jgi:hypothetical protein
MPSLLELLHDSRCTLQSTSVCDCAISNKLSLSEVRREESLSRRFSRIGQAKRFMHHNLS